MDMHGVYCIYFVFSMIHLLVDSQNTADLDCSSTSQVIVIDSVDYGTEDCSALAYLELARSCHKQTQCSVTTAELTTNTGCPVNALSPMYTCVDSDQVIEICPNSDASNSLLYVTSPGFPSPTPPGYKKNFRCEVTLNANYNSTMTLLAISTHARSPSGGGCYDRLRVFVDGFQNNEVCGSTIYALEGDTTQTTWMNVPNLKLFFLSDSQSNQDFYGFIVKIESLYTTTTTTESSVTAAETTTTSTGTTVSTTPTTSTQTESSTVSTTGSSTSTQSQSSITTSGDDCLNNQCLNGATCVDDVGTYNCNCADGYTGTYCADIIITTTTDPLNSCSDNPCKNGATCQDDLNGAFYCECTTGWSDKLCDVEVEVSGSSRSVGSLHLVSTILLFTLSFRISSL